MITCAPAARSFDASGCYCLAERRYAKALHIRRQRRSQCPDRHDADEADFDAGGLDEHRRAHVRPLDDAPGRLVDQVGREKRKPGSCSGRFDRTARVVAERLTPPSVSTGPKSNS